MEQFTFEKDGATKVCHCNPGVKADLLKQGWVEKAAKPKAGIKPAGIKSAEATLKSKKA